MPTATRFLSYRTVGSLARTPLFCTIEDLSPLQHLPALRKLTFFECQAVRDLTPLLALPRLEELHVFGMRQVKVPPELNKRVKVRRRLVTPVVYEKIWQAEANRIDS